MVRTIMKKNLIKQRFSKNLNTYQDNAIIQMNMAKKLISLLPDKNFSNILELGCGTGFLTKLANKNLNYKSYTAIDIVKECEPYIKRVNNDINFISDDIETINLTETYDLIISNAVFQWLNDFERFITKLQNNLSSNGIILFTTFGTKNFQEISKVANISLKYYSPKELQHILETYSIEYLEEETFEEQFKTTKEMFEHMKKTGVNAISETAWTLKDFKEFNQHYQNIYKDGVHLTYNPIYVLLKH